MMRLIFSILAVSLLLARGIEIQKCPEDQGGSKSTFPRMFVLRYNGPGTPRITETRAADILGSCRSTREFAAGMRQYFETFGIDLSTMTNPYETFENERFSISGFGITADGDYRVLLSSFYSFAEISNAKVSLAIWGLIAKVQLDGSEMILVPDSWALYGMYRLTFPYEEFCIEFHNRNPHGIGPSGNFPLDLNLKSHRLGNGTLLGLIINRNVTQEVRSVLAFGMPAVL